MLGVIINAATIILGAIIGLFLKKGINERISNGLMTCIGFATIYIGITGTLTGEKTLIMIISLALGSLAGFAIDIDRRFTTFSEKLENKFSKNKNHTFAQGFIAASLLMGIGAMAIVGPLQSGLIGDNSTLFVKSILDFISAIIFASSLGIGVAFASITIFIEQGLIALFAQFLSPVLSTSVINEMTCVGSLLILGLGLNLVGATKLKIANFLPAIFLPIVLCPLYDLIYDWIVSIL